MFAAGIDAYGQRLVALAAEGKCNTPFVLSAAGIDVCGQRLVELVEKIVVEAALEGKGAKGGGPVDRISFIGYSLGGLISRFAIGRLHALGASFVPTLSGWG